MSKDSHILTLTEDKEQLETELKSYQENSISSISSLNTTVESLEISMNEYKQANLLLSENYQKLFKIYTVDSTTFKEEIESLKQAALAHESQSSSISRELRKANEKIKELHSSNTELSEQLTFREETCKNIEAENSQLKQGLFDHARTIRSLVSDVSEAAQDAYDIKDEAIDKLKKQLNCKKSELKKAEAKYQESSSEREEFEEKLAAQQAALAQRTESFDKERKSLSVQVTSLLEEREQLLESSRKQEEAFTKAKEGLYTEMQNRILELKQEKGELESVIDELSNQVEINRSSISESNLQDELSQLGERLSSNNTPRRYSNFDFKRNEKYVQELSEKNFQIMCLQGEKEALNKQLSENNNLLNELYLLQADNERLTAELAASQKGWETYIAGLTAELEQFEQVAIEAKQHYAEAATDRDVYYKMYLDYKKSAEAPVNRVKRKTANK